MASSAVIILEVSIAHIAPDVNRTRLFAVWASCHARPEFLLPAKPRRGFDGARFAEEQNR